jgi:hypothetical protein
MQVRGWGATPCKGVFASALAALSGLPELRRPVWLAVSTEGSSSHGGSRRLLDDLDLRASAGIVLTGTDLAISRANRGRIDVVIRIRGETCHSSQPSLGSNPFDRLPEILDLLRRLVTPPEGRTLGLATVTPFAIRHSPFAIRHSPFEPSRCPTPSPDPAGIVRVCRPAAASWRVARRSHCIGLKGSTRCRRRERNGRRFDAGRMRAGTSPDHRRPCGRRRGCRATA